MEGSVPLLCPSVEAGGVLDEEVNDMQGAAGFLRDGVMQARLIELLGTDDCEKFIQPCGRAP